MYASKKNNLIKTKIHLTYLAIFKHVTHIFLIQQYLVTIKKLTF